MDLTQAQAQFNILLKKVDAQTMPAFLRWTKRTADNAIEEIEDTNEDTVLKQISEDIRKELPRNATLLSESITFPIIGENADCDPATTVHVDAFLYPEEVVDDLCDDQLMSRNFCKECGSHQTAPLSTFTHQPLSSLLTFISHSISMSQLKYLFQYLLPDLCGKSVVDVGSRLGTVLYGAYYYSAASKIIGVEMNADLCTLQGKVVEKNQLHDRVKVICADIRTQFEVLQSADVIILHNVFEFFMPVEAQEKIWGCIRQCVQRPGVLLVTSPSLEQATEHLQVSLEGWVEQEPTENATSRANLALFGEKKSENSDLGDIFLYRVL